MPVSCPGGGKARYRWAHGGKVRLAFCGKGRVVEAKSKGGAVHTPAEFRADARRERRSSRRTSR